jgi:hypothetical protein
LTEQERKIPPKTVRHKARGMVVIKDKDGNIKAELPVTDVDVMEEHNEDRQRNTSQ